MKKLCLFAVVFALGVMAVVTPARAGDPETAVSQQLHAFYAAYMHVLNADGDALKSNRAMLKKYVSARFLKKVDKANNSDEGQEGDPFICGQDWDPGWEKNIAVQKQAVRGESATAEVVLSGKEMTPHHLAVKLVRAEGTWKIDAVTDADPRTDPPESPSPTPAAQ